MATIAPRCVFVVRETDYERLIAHHATREQVRFFLKTRGQELSVIEARHDRFHERLREVRSAVPADWRSVLIKRDDFDRFLFAGEDIVIAFGQDGLVANVAKYLDGQPVLGVNPNPEIYDGILVPHAPGQVAALLKPVAASHVQLERRTMVEAKLDDGQTLSALNEIFIGHRTHQSARYEIAVTGRDETQSSSGLIVSSGTGATGWARSIMESIQAHFSLHPEEEALAYFIREPFPSVSTGTSVRAGKITKAEPLRVTSRMNDGGVIFADGIEQDHLDFGWGRIVEVHVSARRLNLVAKGAR
jgi:NAD kinase